MTSTLTKFLLAYRSFSRRAQQKIRLKIYYTVMLKHSPSILSPKLLSSTRVALTKWVGKKRSDRLSDRSNYRFLTTNGANISMKWTTCKKALTCELLRKQ